MGELRFQVRAVRPGAAARSAEAAARSTAAPDSPRVRAGSSARLAEDEKRNAAPPAAGMSTLGLRGQGGRVTRSGEFTSVPHPIAGAAPVPTGATQAAVSLPGSIPPKDPLRTAARSREGSPMPADPPPTVKGRLQSIFQTLFKSGEPS